jgi:hypothetical protein
VARIAESTPRGSIHTAKAAQFGVSSMPSLSIAPVGSTMIENELVFKLLGVFGFRAVRHLHYE